MGAGPFSFVISEDVRRLGVTGAYFILRGVRNRAADPAFAALRDAEVERARSGLSRESIAADPVLKGFHLLHAAVGRDSRRNLASPENLREYLWKTGKFPQVNLLVDIYNLISLRTGLALGAHDLASVEGGIALRLTRGDERFHPLGAPGPEPVKPGEYSYVDDGNEVLCRMEVRQVEKTKVTETTRDVFYIVQGNPNTDEGLLRSATEELIRLTREHCGGELQLLEAPWLSAK